MVPASFDLIVSAPDHNAGVIAQALDLVDRLLPDVFLEGNVAWNHVSTEHEFLPDHDPEFVADIVEIIGLVVAAAPLTDHIHVRVASRLENVAVNFRSDAIGEAIEGDYISALGEHRNAVDHELETLAPLIGSATQLYGTQSSFCFGMRRGIASDADCSGETVTVLGSIANRKPEFWRGNAQGKRNMIDAGVELQSLGSVGGLRSGHFIMSQRESCCCRLGGVDIKLGCDVGQVTCNSVLVDMEVIDAKRVPGFKPHRLPNALGHITRSPIPAVVVRSFAGVGRG